MEMDLNCSDQRPANKRARCEKASESGVTQEVTKKKKSDECNDETPEKRRPKPMPEAKEKLLTKETSRKYVGVRANARRDGTPTYQGILSLPVGSLLPERCWHKGSLYLGTFPTARGAAKGRDLAAIALNIIKEGHSQHNRTEATYLNFPEEKHTQESIDRMRQFICGEQGYIGVRSITWCDHRVSFGNKPLGSYESSAEAAMCYDKACLAVFGMMYKGRLNFDVATYDDEGLSSIFESVSEKVGLTKLNALLRSESHGVKLTGFRKYTSVFQKQGFSTAVGVFSSLHSAKRAYDLCRLAFDFHTNKKFNFPRRSYRKGDIDYFRRDIERNFPNEVKTLLNNFCRVLPSANSIIDGAFRNLKPRAPERAEVPSDKPIKAESSDRIDSAVPENNPDSGHRVVSDGEALSRERNGGCFHEGTSQGRSAERLEGCSVDFISVPAKDEPIESVVGVVPLSNCADVDFERGNRGSGEAKQEHLQSRMGPIGGTSVQLGGRVSSRCDNNLAGVGVKEEDSACKVEEDSKRL